jgi:phosphate uptake regulator
MAQNETSGSDLEVSRRETAALYRRAAITLERSADLAEQHAARLTVTGQPEAARAELERAEQARAAAQRGRDLAARMQ